MSLIGEANKLQVEYLETSEFSKNDINNSDNTWVNHPNDPKGLVFYPIV